MAEQNIGIGEASVSIEQTDFVSTRGQSDAQIHGNCGFSDSTLATRQGNYVSR